MTELWEHDAWELADGVRRGELKSTALVDAFLARVEKFDPDLNAFCHLDVDGARDARRRDRRRRSQAAATRGRWPGCRWE